MTTQKRCHNTHNADAVAVAYSSVPGYACMLFLDRWTDDPGSISSWHAREVCM